MKRTRAGAGQGLLAIGWLFAVSPLVLAQTAEELRRDIERRDQTINELEQRVRSLEENMKKPAPAPVPAPGARAPEQRSQETVDEELLSRALERSLVRSGGALLRPRQMEIEPGLLYEYSRRSGPAIIGPAVAQQDIRTETFFALLGFRAGLPWTSQVEIAVPYGRQRIETVTAGVLNVQTETGVGDWSIGLSKLVLEERDRGRPGLVANVTYQNSDVDRSNLVALAPGSTALPASTPALGQGYDSIHLRLTALKRFDPLVFVGSLGYSFNDEAEFAGQKLDPGNSANANLRGILAASPEVSVRAGFGLSWTPDVKLNGTTIEGSNATVVMLELGTSISLTRSTLLDISLAVGATDASPDFVFNVALPIRF
jgi:Putative MetA-pathway of phenol degradation